MTLSSRLLASALVLLALVQPVTLVLAEDGGPAPCATSCCCEDARPGTPELTRSSCGCCETEPPPATPPASSLSNGARPELAVDGTDLVGSAAPMAVLSVRAVTASTVRPARATLALFCVRIV